MDLQGIPCTRLDKKMKKTRILLTLLLWGWGAAASAQGVENRLVDAVALVDAGEYAQAKNLLGPLSKAAPDNDAVWYYLGLSEAGLDEVDAAVIHLKQAVELDPHNYWYKQRLAALYQVKGEDEMVIQMYESILSEFPDKTAVSYDLLGLYLKQGQYEKALQALSDVEDMTGPSEQIARTRYDIYRQLDKPEEAIRTLEAFNEQFTSPSVLSMMGDYYLSEYNDSLALRCYQEALLAQSDYIPALLGESEVYRTTRRYSDYFTTIGRFMENPDVPAEAKGMYVGNLTRNVDPKLLNLHRSEFDGMVGTMQECHPSDSTVLTTAGAYFYSTGRPERAKDCFREVADLYPESLAHTVTYIQLLSMQEEWEEMRDRSVAAFDRFHELGFMDYLNMADYHLGDYDAIIGNNRYLIAASKDDKDRQKACWSAIGDMYHQKGDSKAAYQAYEKALKLDPDYAPVLNNYAYYLSQEGKKLKKAYAMSKKTVEAEPDNATYLDTFAWILHLQGKDLEAKPFFKHAMLYGGKDSAVILDHYAEVLYALGEYDLAKVYWSQARAKNADGSVADLEERIEVRLKSMGR